jgi:MFS family permease
MQNLRKRDLLLSLKYSTVEACFSVPMLNLTLPNFPFVIAFAVKVLGWKSATIGWMAALPHICNFVQPFLLARLYRVFSTYQLLVLMFSLGALPWGLAGVLSGLSPSSRHTMFDGMLLVGTLASSIAAVSWSAAISELVPERLGGRYFARRNLIFGVWTLALVMAAGQFAEWQGNSLMAFGWIFCLAGISRLFGLFFLTRMRFPASVMKQQNRGIVLGDLLLALKDRNYLRLCLFVGIWGFLLNAAMPFYTVFIVDQLKLGIGTVVKMTTLASIGGLLTLKSWGKLCERFGNRPVLQVAALIWAITALTMWSFARPGWTWHLYLGYLIVGGMTAGFQLTQFNLMIRLAPPDQRSAYVAAFLAITSLLTASGPILGGKILKLLPLELGSLFGYPILNFHLLFVCAAFACILVTHLVRNVHEQADQPAVNVWREMKTMRAFNPMISVLSVGELLLTPRGLVAIAQRSIRTVKQQVKALEDVGEEIATGSREFLGKPNSRKQ